MQLLLVKIKSFIRTCTLRYSTAQPVGNVNMGVVHFLYLLLSFDEYLKLFHIAKSGRLFDDLRLSNHLKVNSDTSIFNAFTTDQ